MYSQIIFSALIELTHPIELSSSIQPVKLPNDCGEFIDNFVAAVTAGNGMTTFTGGNKSDTTLREATLTTMPYHICENITVHEKDIRSIICANSTDKQSAFHGDSGNLGVFF